MPEAPVHRITVGNRPPPKRPTVGSLNARNFVVRSEAVQLPAPVPAVLQVPLPVQQAPQPLPPPPAQVVAAMPPDAGQHPAAQAQTQMILQAQEQYLPQGPQQPPAVVVEQSAGPDWGTLLLMFGLLWALDHFSKDDEE